MFLLRQFICDRVSCFAFTAFPLCCCLVVSTDAINFLQNDLLCVEWDVKPYTLTDCTKSEISVSRLLGRTHRCD